jgi:indole-3-glycerol phosphate synthase
LSANRLEEILQARRQDIAELKARAPELRRQALLRNDFRSLRTALRRADGEIAVIAEVKRASPSAGVIVGQFDPVEIASRYQAAGTDAISVLTEERFFKGSIDHLQRVREMVTCPVLRKDFIIDEIQIAESVVAGADAILLIVAALPQDELVRFREIAAAYQLDAIVEVHSLPEMERALEADAEIIGINNRDLTTLSVDLGVTEQLVEEIPAEIIAVSESGIRTEQDFARIAQSGVNAVLIGESFLRGDLSLDKIRGGYIANGAGGKN